MFPLFRHTWADGLFLLRAVFSVGAIAFVGGSNGLLCGLLIHLFARVHFLISGPARVSLASGLVLPLCLAV